MAMLLQPLFIAYGFDIFTLFIADLLLLSAQFYYLSPIYVINLSICLNF